MTKAFFDGGSIAADGTFDLALAEPIVEYVLALQVLHEAGHVLAASVHGLNVRPFLLLPSTTIGCAGGHVVPPGLGPAVGLALRGHGAAARGVDEAVRPQRGRCGVKYLK